jgi:hypothetical protein
LAREPSQRSHCRLPTANQGLFFEDDVAGVAGDG